MPIKKRMWKNFCEVVGEVDRCVNAFEEDEVALRPIIQRKVLNVNMMCMCSRFLCISHCSTAIVVFISHCSHFLRYIKISENTTNKEAHPANIAGCHEFCLSGRQCNSRLELSFVSNGVAGKLDTDTTERTTCFDTSGPIRIAKCHCSLSIMGRAVIEQEVM